MQQYIIMGIAGLAVIAILTIAFNYIVETRAETIANEAILSSKLLLQQEEIRIKEELEAEYKDKIKVVEKVIEKEVPIVSSDGTCESELESINILLKYKLSSKEIQ